MKRTYLPLQGPNGVRPKAPAVGAWQSPGYSGVELGTPEANTWIGMRCDGLVVIDCDSREAADYWLKQTGQLDTGTWVRRTPRGYHFIYLWTEGSPTAPAADVFGGGSHVDIRAGRTSQIVYQAPGYEDVHNEKNLAPFNPTWLPLDFAAATIDRSESESWDEMPDGRGNNTMTAIAGAMRKQGMSALVIAKCLGAINKITMTTDPMPTEMIVLIAKSVSRYEARPDVDIEFEE